MSKSFHQKPDFSPATEKHIKNYFKHYANKKVRKIMQIDNGSQYKKIFNSQLTRDARIKLVTRRLWLDSFIEEIAAEDLLKSG
jgi:hypothetical protein